MNSDPDLMSSKIIGLQKHHFIGGDHRQLMLLCQRNSILNVALFISAPGADKFQIKPVCKVLLIKIQQLRYALRIVLQQRFAN